MTFDIQELQNKIKEWSDNQFSEGIFTHERVLPITHHLKKEVQELIDELVNAGNGDLDNYNYNRVKEEYADCFILLLDSASHFDLSVKDLYKASMDKLEENKKRRWGKPDKNGVVEHIKD